MMKKINPKVKGILANGYVSAEAPSDALRRGRCSRHDQAGNSGLMI
jgi:hypothetical protein